MNNSADRPRDEKARASQSISSTTDMKGRSVLVVTSTRRKSVTPAGTAKDATTAYAQRPDVSESVGDAAAGRRAWQPTPQSLNNCSKSTR